MTNTLTKTEITRLPKLVPDLLQMKLAVDNWQKLHAEAGSQKERAWRDYNNAIDLGLPREVIDSLFGAAMLLDAICRDACKEHEQAKRDLLDLLS